MNLPTSAKPAHRPALSRFFWRYWYRLKFQLFQRQRLAKPVIEQVAGRPFLVLPSVFNPTLFFTSEFMVQALTPALIPAGCSVLDMGTGSGIGAVFAAQWAGRVVAIDINPAAARCARINVLLNQVEDRVTVEQGDLFGPVPGQQFDVIMFNPPYYAGQPTSLFDHAFQAADVLERFVYALPAYLAPAGTVLLLLSSAGEEAAILSLFANAGYEISILQQRTYPLERLTFYRLSPENDVIPARS